MKALRRQLGLWLRQKREEAELTQADLAEHLGLRFHAVVSQVETGIRRIPSDLYEEWAAAIGVDPLVFAMTVLQYSEPNLYGLIEPYYSKMRSSKN